MAQALAFGPDVGVTLASNDPASIEWVLEFFGASLTPTERDANPRLEVDSSASRYAELSAERPADVESRPCFAFDQSMLSLPAWDTDDGLLVADEGRSCVLGVGSSGAKLTGDPRNRRWRFILVLVIHELLATPLRRKLLEIHASAVEAAGRAIVMIGPKRAGKTTLSFHLLRSGPFRWIANDRVFAGVEEGAPAVWGVPTVVRVRPPTPDEFPELASSSLRIDRAFLYTAPELDQAADAAAPEAPELLLSPPQVARQLGVESLGSAPIGAFVFPEVDTALEGWSIERLSREQVSAGIWTNLFGNGSQPRPSTVFEALDGGRIAPDHGLADELARLPGYKVTLGHGAYDDPDFAKRFLESVASGS